MFTGAFARRISAALRISGQRVDININGNHYYKRVVMENTGKNFMRKYDDEHTEQQRLGFRRRRDKLFFVPYFKAFDNYVGDVIITARGKRYRVVADSVITIADEPAYIWAIGSEITVPKGDYYDYFD